MNKKLVGLLLVGAIVVAGLVPSKVAHAAASQTDVTGVITQGGNAVAGATVSATCLGFTQVDSTTDTHGSYLVVFPIVQCPFGSTVKVLAKKGPMSGSSSGTVHSVTTKLNIAIVNVSIPEYGWLGGMLAAGAGIGAVVYARRRYGQSGLGV